MASPAQRPPGGTYEAHTGSGAALTGQRKHGDSRHVPYSPSPRRCRLEQDEPRDETAAAVADGDTTPEPVPVVMHGGVRLPRLGVRAGQETAGGR